MTTWNEATPAGTDYISGGDDIIRDFKIATRERLAREHAMLGSGDDSSDGKHRLAHGLASARPAAIAGHVYIATDTLIVSISPANDVWIDLRADDPPGFMKLYAGSTAPDGWLVCNGNEISRTTYAALFAIIGTTYGLGNGTTSFNLPDLKGRVPVGFDTSQTEFDSLGETGGAKTHTLTAAELAAHTHPISDPTHAHAIVPTALQTSAGGGFGSTSGFPVAGATATQAAATGITATNVNTGGTAHNNLQPYIALNYVIKY